MPRERIQKRPTGDDVAKAAGVSKATVSYVISGRPDVQLPEATRQRVWSAAAALGYRPNRVASALKTGRTGLISVWVDNLLTAFNAHVVHHIEEQVAQHPCQIVVTLMRHLSEADLVAGAFDALPTDGIIAHEQSNRLSAFINVRGLAPMPIVSTGAFNLAEDRVDCVHVDLTVGTHEAVTHLIAQGRRRVAYLTGDEYIRRESPRHAAYRAVVEQSGLQAEYILAPVTANNARVAARIGVRDYVRDFGCPDGLFCLNDEMAIGAYRGLRDLGIRVPDDIAIVGCDGIEETEYGDCPLSTIVQPLAQMCELAWRLLERRMQEPDAPLEHIILPAHLVVRQSSQV